jgi:hypothetical protein
MVKVHSTRADDAQLYVRSTPVEQSDGKSISKVSADFLRRAARVKSSVVVMVGWI